MADSEPSSPPPAPHASLQLANGFWKTDYLPPGGIAFRRVYHVALPTIALTSTPVTSEIQKRYGLIVTLSPEYDTTIYADVVHVLGMLELPERSVRIVARRVVFDDADASKVGISTDGIDGKTPAFLEAAALDPPRAEDGSNGRVRPMIGDIQAKAGTPGGASPGTEAPHGAHGQDGTAAGDIEIFAEEIVGGYTLSACGGNGRAGQNGSAGQPGGNGGDGDEYIDGNAPPAAPLHLVAAQPGGAGGPAGRGGVGGAGGDAGRIVVGTTTPRAVEPTVKNTAGARGKNGIDGVPGIGGWGGATRNHRLAPRGRHQLRGGAGEIKHGSAVDITTQSPVGENNTLGKFGDSQWCYYYAPNYKGGEQQRWFVKRVDGPSPDGKVRYGDHLRFGKGEGDDSSTLVQSWGVFGNDYVCLGSSDEWWVLVPDDPALAGQPISFGQTFYLQHKSGRHITDQSEGSYPKLLRALPGRERAPSGGLRPQTAAWPTTADGELPDPPRELLRLTPAQLAIRWSPELLSMIVKRVRGKYLALDLGGSDFADLGQEVRRWIALVGPAVTAPEPDDALEKDARVDVVAAHGKLSAMDGFLRASRDYFGKLRNFAPNPTFGYYQNRLEKELPALEAFEAKVGAILEDAQKTSRLTDEAVATFNAATLSLEISKQLRAASLAAVTEAYRSLVDADRLFAAERDKLRPGSPHVKKFEDALSGWHCDLATLLQCLELMIFVPPLEHGAKAAPPELSGAGAAMGLVQLTKFIKDGFNTITDADGNAADPKFAISTIHRLDGDLLESAQALVAREHGLFSDPGSAILATLDQWDELLTKFGNLAEAADVKHDVQNLAAAVRARGDAIADFNNKLIDLLVLDARLASLSETRRLSAEQAAALDNPGRLAVVRFLSRALDERTDNVIELVGQANRAYRYWRLDDGTPKLDKHSVEADANEMNVFRAVLAKDARADIYGAIDSSVLSTCASKLNSWCDKAIQEYEGYPQRFPERNTDGFQVWVRESEFPSVIARFRKANKKGIHEVKVTITDDGRNGTLTNEHLAGLGDVRLERFRVILHGVYREGGRSDNRIQISFSHDSCEQNITTLGRRVTFIRDQVEPRDFIYNGVRNVQRYVSGNDGEFASSFIVTDGYYGGTPAMIAGRGLADVYAGVGPYSDWTITLDSKRNSGLVFDKEIDIEIQLLGVGRHRIGA